LSRARKTALAVALLLFGVYALSSGGHTYSSDEEGMLLSARQMLGHGTPELPLSEDNVAVTPSVPGRDGDPVGVSGLAQVVAMAPFLAAGQLVATTVPAAWGDYTVRLFTGFTNAAVTALGVALFFLLCVELGARRRWSVALSLAYGLGTFAWPHAKTMFSEPVTATLLLAAVLQAVRFRTRDATAARHAVLTGVLLGAALFGRTSAVVFVPVVCVYVAAVAYGRAGAGAAAPARPQPVAAAGRVLRAGGLVALGAAPMLALLGVTNWWRFGSPVDLGYEKVPLDHPIHEGLYGLLLSPGKSVFLYAPVAAVGVAAALFARRERRAEVVLALAMAFANVLFFARFVHWHGDHSWGPRYLVLSLPFLLLPLAAVADAPRWWRAVAVAGALGVVSALLGTVMYFNQYFAVAEVELGSGSAPDGPLYWRSLHFDPYWSPLAGHARLLDDVARQGVKGVEEGMPAKPFVGRLSTTQYRYFWYFGPPSPDSWIYWNRAARGPTRMLLLAPLQVAAVVGGALLLRRSLVTAGTGEVAA
jgi:hypothetical protein